MPIKENFENVDLDASLLVDDYLVSLTELFYPKFINIVKVPGIAFRAQKEITDYMVLRNYLSQ